MTRSSPRPWEARRALRLALGPGPGGGGKTTRRTAARGTGSQDRPQPPGQGPCWTPAPRGSGIRAPGPVGRAGAAARGGGGGSRQQGTPWEEGPGCTPPGRIRGQLGWGQDHTELTSTATARSRSPGPQSAPHTALKPHHLQEPWALVHTPGLKVRARGPQGRTGPGGRGQPLHESPCWTWGAFSGTPAMKRQGQPRGCRWPRWDMWAGGGAVRSG